VLHKGTYDPDGYHWELSVQNALKT
jgi:hypothetical protein